MLNQHIRYAQCKSIPLFSYKKIQKRVRQLAVKITKDYRHKKPIFIGVLKGSFIFLAELIRHLEMPLECDFIDLSSYGKRTVSSGKIKLKAGISESIKGRDVIIIDDIIDTGLTIDFLLKKLRSFSPRSVRLCTLLDKPNHRQVKIKIDYCGFKTPDKFIVGYGLDYKGQYRNLPYVGYFISKKLK